MCNLGWSNERGWTQKVKPKIKLNVLRGLKHVIRTQRGRQMLDIINQNQTFLNYYHLKPQ
jgi:hypothetical protein